MPPEAAAQWIVVWGLSAILYPFYAIIIMVIHAKTKNKPSGYSFFMYFLAFAPLGYVIASLMIINFKKKLSARAFRKEQQELKIKQLEIEKQLEIACNTEKKLTVYAKIPKHSGILVQNLGDLSYYLDTYEYKHKKHKSISFVEEKSNKRHYQYRRTIFKYSPLFSEVPNATFIDMDEDYIDTNESIAQYLFSSETITTPEDSAKQINRIHLTLTNRKTKKLLAEYTGFYPAKMKRYYNKSDLFAKVCLANADQVGRTNDITPYEFLDAVIDSTPQQMWQPFTENQKIAKSSQFDEVWPFKEGLAIVAKDNKKGFIDEQGKIVIPIQFEDVGSFNNGRAIFRQGDKWGFIDTKGTIVVPAQYDFVLPFVGNLAQIQSSYGYLGLINFDGTIILSPNYNEITRINEGFVKFREGSEEGLLNPEGKIIINLGELDIDNVINGYAMVSKEGKQGIIDTNQQDTPFVLPLEYDRIQVLKHEGEGLLVKLEREDKYGITNVSTNTVLLPLKYDEIGTLYRKQLKHLMKIKQNGKYGIFDLKQNKITLPTDYNSISTFKSKKFKNFIKIQKDEKYGIFDLNRNKITLPVNYTSIKEFIDEKFKQQEALLVQLELKGSYGVTDVSTNTVVLPIEYDKIRPNYAHWPKQTLTVRKNGKYNNFDLNQGKFKYDERW